MTRKPSSQLHLPLLALLALALILSIATLACAATTLNLFESQQSTNPWLLPVWRSHFDLRGLKLVVGTSAAIALFDLVAMVVVVLVVVQVRFPLTSIWSIGLSVIEDAKPTLITISQIEILTNIVSQPQILPLPPTTALLISATTSLISACLALPAATLPLVLNARAPGKDTLQSWTCSWVSQNHDGMPGDFGRVCGESVSLVLSVRSSKLGKAKREDVHFSLSYLS
jgi:hypothetical protein